MCSGVTRELAIIKLSESTKIKGKKQIKNKNIIIKKINPKRSLIT